MEQVELEPGLDSGVDPPAWLEEEVRAGAVVMMAAAIVEVLKQEEGGGDEQPQDQDPASSAESGRVPATVFAWAGPAQHGEPASPVCAGG